MASSTASATLQTLLPEWQRLLQGWAAEGRLTAAAQEALMLQEEPRALRRLVKRWAAGDFGDLPPVVLLSASELPGAMGAYAISTGTIYLNQDWLLGASQEQALAVLTEELGHHLDGVVNEGDTPGDEGEYFARLLLEKFLIDIEKSRLRAQRDSGIVLSSEEEIQAENAVAPVIRGNSIYVIVDGPTWAQAEANAVKLGGHLTAIGDAQENGWIAAEFSKNKYDYPGDQNPWDPQEWHHLYLGLAEFRSQTFQVRKGRLSQPVQPSVRDISFTPRS